MGKLSASRGVDVTYVRRDQLAVITRRKPAQRSQRAKAALARAAERRGASSQSR